MKYLNPEESLQSLIFVLVALCTSSTDEVSSVSDMYTWNYYGTAPVDPCRPQNRGSHDYLPAHKGSRRMSRPLIQDSSVRVLFPRYKGNLTLENL